MGRYKETEIPEWQTKRNHSVNSSMIKHTNMNKLIKPGVKLFSDVKDDLFLKSSRQNKRLSVKIL